MRPLLLAVALAGAVHTLCAPSLVAQSRSPVWGLTTLTRGQPVQGKLTRRMESLLYEGKYVREFFYQARAGETPQLRLHAEFPGEWSVNSYISRGSGGSGFSMEDIASSLYSCGGATPTPANQVKICDMKGPLEKDAEVYIMLVADRPGKFVVAAYGNGSEGNRNEVEFFGLAQRGQTRSRTSGLELSAGYGTVTFEGSQGSGESGNWTEKGVGPHARLGLGFGALSLFAEGQMSEMAPEEAASDGSDDYTLYHADLGSRLYFLGSGSWLRPFVQVAYGIRRVASQIEAGDAEMEGETLTPGAGVQLFLVPGLSIEGSYRRTSGNFTRFRFVGEEWMDLPENLIVTGPSNRLSAQMVVHF